MFHVAEVEDDEEDELGSEGAPLLPPPSPRSARKFDSVRNLLEKVICANSKVNTCPEHGSVTSRPFREL